MIDDILTFLLNAFQPQEYQPREEDLDLEMLAQYLQERNMTPNDLIRKIEEKRDIGYEPMSEIPYQNKSAGNLSDLAEALKKRESGGRYDIANPLGYIGAYQFGAPALETVGLLKSGAGKLGNKALFNPENWQIPGGRKSFLSNPEIQDEAMNRLMASNQKRLTGMGLINKSTPQNIINGMLAAAHLSGPGGVRNLFRGKNSRDAFGTPASAYFKLGARL